MKRIRVAAIGFLLALFSRAAIAQDAPAGAQAEIGVDVQTEEQAAIRRAYEHPHTMAQLGVGMLTLPSADVCLKGRDCTKGDTSIEADFWQLYRASRAFAIGAGATIALVPTTDNPPSAADIERSHTRSYFLVEAVARYYWLTPTWMESWLGVTAGGVIVSDRYSVTNEEQSNVALIGPGAATVRTEGGAVGALLGAQWTFATNWAAGLQVRYARWFLPSTPAINAFQDRATLTDSQGMLDIGILCTYRIPL